MARDDRLFALHAEQVSSQLSLVDLKKAETLRRLAARGRERVQTAR